MVSVLFIVLVLFVVFFVLSSICVSGLSIRDCPSVFSYVYLLILHMMIRQHDCLCYVCLQLSRYDLKYCVIVSVILRNNQIIIRFAHLSPFLSPVGTYIRVLSQRSKSAIKSKSHSPCLDCKVDRHSRCSFYQISTKGDNSHQQNRQNGSFNAEMMLQFKICFKFLHAKRFSNHFFSIKTILR